MVDRMDGAILPTIKWRHSGHQIHPQQQVLKARVLAEGAARGSNYSSPSSYSACVLCGQPGYYADQHKHC